MSRMENAHFHFETVSFFKANNSKPATHNFSPVGGGFPFRAGGWFRPSDNFPNFFTLHFYFLLSHPSQLSRPSRQNRQQATASDNLSLLPSRVMSCRIPSRFRGAGAKPPDPCRGRGGQGPALSRPNAVQSLRPTVPVSCPRRKARACTNCPQQARTGDNEATTSDNPIWEPTSFPDLPSCKRARRQGRPCSVKFAAQAARPASR